MNFLAHLLLSGPDGDFRAGGFLGDFVRGPLTGRHPAAIESGIALHRHLDAASDRSDAVHTAVRRLPPAWRRWAPVALDVIFDHFLARDFQRWQAQPLGAFAADCYRQLDARRRHFPDSARRMLDRMTEVDLLCAYADPQSVPRALGHLARRSRRRNPLAEIGDGFRRWEPELEAAFARLMPQLSAISADWRAGRRAAG